MRKTQRFAALLLALVLLASLAACPVFAAVMSSDYIDTCTATLQQGTSNGELKLVYLVTGTGSMDYIGPLNIKVYKSNGTLYHTYYGTINNGLIKQNSWYSGGTFRFTAATGFSYYCEVEFYAWKNGSNEKQTVTTGTVSPPVVP